jgi:membrane associated rhomboid family serine protease
MTSSDSTTAIISAHSRRQAMDWSLALISQEIESTILHTEEGWSLAVASADYGRAVAIIEQYQRENRGWEWRRELQWPGITFHAGGTIWCLLLVLLHWATPFLNSDLKSAGIMDSVAVLNGEWWRLFTATMLHADIAHLIANVTIGFVVFGLAMGRYGAGCALLAAYLAGAGGNVAGLLFYPEPYRGLGASGMVMGGLGLLTIQTLSLRRENPHAVKYIISGVFAGFLLFVLLGLDPASDVIAHLGGFVSGLAIGSLLTLFPAKTWNNEKFDFASKLLLTGLVILTWALALK